MNPSSIQGWTCLLSRNRSSRSE